MNKSSLDVISNGKRSAKTEPEGHRKPINSKITGNQQEESTYCEQVNTGTYDEYDGEKVEDSCRSSSPFPFAGIILALFSSFLFSISFICVKLLPDSQGFEEKMKIAAFRGSQMMFYCSINAIWNKTSLLVDRTELWLIITRSLLGTIGTFGTFCSLKYITPGESTALMFCSPIWTSILSYIVFKEPLRWIYLIALPGSLLGITLIADPILLGLNMIVDNQQSVLDLDYVSNDDDYNSTTTTAAIERRLPGIIMALTVSLSLSFSFIVLKLRSLTTVNATTFWFGVSILTSSLMAMSLIGFGKIPDTLREWMLLLAMGICSYGAQILMQWSFDFESPSVLAIVSTAEVVFTFAVSAIVLEQTTYWTSFVGALLILLVVLTIMLSNWFSTKAAAAAAEDKQQRRQVKQVDGDEVQVKVD